MAPHPYGLALSPDGKTLVTVNSGTHPFSASIVTDIFGLAPRVAQIPSGFKSSDADPESVFLGAAIARDNRTLYLSEGNDGKVGILDLATHQRLGSLNWMVNSRAKRTATVSLESSCSRMTAKFSLSWILRTSAWCFLIPPASRPLPASPWAGCLSAPVETAAGRELKARLQALGVLRQTTGHEHLNGCVVFPIHGFAGASTGSGQGNVVQLYGRRIAAGADPRHLYLTGPQRGVWNGGALLPGADWILCEALIDGSDLVVPRVAQRYGELRGPRLRPRSLGLARRAQTRPPGHRLRRRHRGPHPGRGARQGTGGAKNVAVWRAAPPEGKDINDVAREADDPAAALRAVIDGAKKIAGPVIVTMPAAVPAVTPAPRLLFL